MKHQAAWLALGLAIGCAGSASASFLSAEGEFSALFSSLEWRSRCSKPVWPMLRGADEFAVSRAKNDYDEYQSCLVRRAKADAEYAAGAVFDSAKKELAGVQSDGQIYGWSFR